MDSWANTRKEVQLENVTKFCGHPTAKWHHTPHRKTGNDWNKSPNHPRRWKPWTHQHHHTATKWNTITHSGTMGRKLKENLKHPKTKGGNPPSHRNQSKFHPTQRNQGWKTWELRVETTKSRDPKAKSRDPKAKSREPKAESQEPRTKSQEPRAESQEPRAKMLRDEMPRAKSREPRAKSGGPSAKRQSWEPRAKSQEMRAEGSKEAHSQEEAPLPWRSSL